MNICVDLDSGVYNPSDVYYLKFDLRQEYSYNSNYSWFRVKTDNNVISDLNGNSYFKPNTPNSDPWQVKYDISAYIALNSFDFDFQTCNKYGFQIGGNTGINNGDNGYVDNIEVYKAIFGCTDNTMYNYNSLANTDNGTCEPYFYGCTDPIAINYNPAANTDDGSCNYCSAVADIGSDTIVTCDSILLVLIQLLMVLIYGIVQIYYLHHLHLVLEIFIKEE